MTDSVRMPENADDRIIRAVIENARPWINSGYRKQPPMRIGRGQAYVVTFNGEDGEARVSYVYDSPDGVEVYDDYRLLVAKHNTINYSDERFILTACLAFGFIVVILSIVCMSLWRVSDAGLQGLTGLAGSILGYIIAVLGGQPKVADRGPRG